MSFRCKCSKLNSVLFGNDMRKVAANYTVEHLCRVDICTTFYPVNGLPGPDHCSAAHLHLSLGVLLRIASLFSPKTCSPDQCL